MTAPDTPAAVADRLDALHAQLVALHADAEAACLPQGVLLGLHWLIEDAAKTLAHLRGMIHQQQQDARPWSG